MNNNKQSEADRIFDLFHPMPNNEERAALYKKWRALLKEIDNGTM